MNVSKPNRLLLWAMLAAAFTGIVWSNPEQSHAVPTIHPVMSGDNLILEFPDEDGATRQETIPVHKAGHIRYFSAGVGLEERSVRYPPFSLKVIFVAGRKSYLSQVSVKITDAGGKVLVEVPREQVTGPWLFVDLPSGTYNVSASGEGRPDVAIRVAIETKHTKTVYVRWKEEAR